VWTGTVSAQTPAPTPPPAPETAATPGGAAGTGTSPKTLERSDAAAGERLSDAAELDRVASLYTGGRYVECKERLAWLLDPKNPKRLRSSAVEPARMYHATCLLMLGETQAAAEPIRKALGDNPTMASPDRLTFPPPLISLFLRVRDEFKAQIEEQERVRLKSLQMEAEKLREREDREAKRRKKLEQLASQRTVVEENRRWIATVPFGVGQFQNGSDALGWGFLVTEAALAGTTVASWFLMSYQYELLGDPSNSRKDIVRNARIAYNVQLVTSYAFLAVALGGVTEAHINFVDQKQRIENRPLSDELKSGVAESVKVSPWLSALPGGGSVGVFGTF
jgi:hypothetical protein